jgi:hypothetical protein
MGKAAVHQPHDKLFKATFSKLRNARAFFQNQLPADIVAGLKWNTLRRLSTTFIHPGLKGSESDLLFAVGARGSDTVYHLLLEHQSTEDPHLALRLAGYVQRLLERWVRENPASAKLPPVLAMVLAQGREPWKAARDLDGMFRAEGPASFVEFFKRHQLGLLYYLVDLSRLEYAALRGTPDGVMALRALKAERTGELLNDWVWDEKLLSAISPDAFRQWISYIANSVVHRAAFLRRIDSLHTQSMKNKAQTLAEQLIEFGREEGREEGRQEGREEGREKGLKEGLRQGLRQSAIQSILQALTIKHGRVPDGLAEAVGAIRNQRKLEELLSRAIRAATLEEFAQAL